MSKYSKQREEFDGMLTLFLDSCASDFTKAANLLPGFYEKLDAMLDEAYEQGREDLSKEIEPMLDRIEKNNKKIERIAEQLNN